MGINAVEGKRKLVGICGIYCGSCPKYLASRIQDHAYLNQTSQETGYLVEEIRCDGCLSDKVYPTCIECRHGFRECSKAKGVTWCFECTDFPCQRLRDFLNIHVVNGISHHALLIEELHYMKDHGIDAWVEKQEKASQCPSCRQRVYWHDHQCPYCKMLLERNQESRNL
jgi:hypothetical protein